MQESWREGGREGGGEAGARWGGEVGGRKGGEREREGYSHESWNEFAWSLFHGTRRVSLCYSIGATANDATSENRLHGARAPTAKDAPGTSTILC